MMKKTKALVSHSLATLEDNIERTGDPLGFKTPYWTEWSRGLHVSRGGDCLLVTGRMYQMLPYAAQMAVFVDMAKNLLTVKSMNRLISVGNRLAGETLLRLRAKNSVEIKKKGERALIGIFKTVRASGRRPVLAGEKDPYSGALLYDLGLEGALSKQILRAYEVLKEMGIEEIVTVDPHTTHMMRKIYPAYVPKYDIRVRHYLEILEEKKELEVKEPPEGFPTRFVIHDSCVMTRELGIIENTRRLASALNLEIIDPKNTGINTACCGGPVEYAFPDLSRSISAIRMRELASLAKDILVSCPICLLNFYPYEESLGVRIWDMGEILFQSL